MSLRIGDHPATTGMLVNVTGFGVLGSEIPSSGVDGPAFLYESLDLPSDNDKEYLALFDSTVTGLDVSLDTSFEYNGESGAFGFTVWQDGQNIGTADLIFNITSEVTVNASPSNSNSVSNTASVTIGANVVISSLASNTVSASNPAQVILAAPVVVTGQVSTTESISNSASVSVSGAVFVSAQASITESIGNAAGIQIGALTFTVNPQTNIDAPYLSTNIDG